jgi:hypothetical protein
LPPSLYSSGILRLHSTIVHSSSSKNPGSFLHRPNCQFRNYRLHTLREISSFSSKSNFPTATVKPSAGVRPGPRSRTLYNRASFQSSEERQTRSLLSDVFIGSSLGLRFYHLVEIETLPIYTMESSSTASTDLFITHNTQIPIPSLLPIQSISWSLHTGTSSVQAPSDSIPTILSGPCSIVAYALALSRL